MLVQQVVRVAENGRAASESAASLAGLARLGPIQAEEVDQVDGEHDATAGQEAGPDACDGHVSPEDQQQDDWHVD